MSPLKIHNRRTLGRIFRLAVKKVFNVFNNEGSIDMRYSTKGVLLVLAVLFSMIAAQAPMAAETSTVTGIIQGISTKPNMVIVDDAEVYGVSFKKLEMHNIFSIQENMLLLMYMNISAPAVS
jgi:hypothetical protein